ncbi:ClpAP chaperone-protease complex specificity factor [Campylobacter blaseri]|uniref:ATP-dependent Clp protease adapter protein ClpS n=1 Tax=Campylobacter blaseri TaxID=2042961 RepID=A0A2P8R1X4_9BACT|nr:ATP-dependent Clp protease adaptor ClpS [Campylobacter blaseri]PSM52494.1 ATP-dependent Clp protease adaptor ClpS [Campylobacter blaseri]PSM54142.1 ATP-dependent Clp protease adaptor ClpS [Campylobacter blaseri]QKF85790.1 ClpAP chaperone-protease complex specificity factor [Campylobacter blaseri]
MPKQSETVEKTKFFIPKLYNVILHNDDKTTMDFVVDILIQIFNKSFDEAVETMLKIHNSGQAICGTYQKEIAISKQKAVLNSAKVANFPLQCTIEKE